MESQIRKQLKDLWDSKSWTVWTIAGVVALVAVLLKELLFFLALVCFARALWLAWPEIKKQLDKN